VNYRQQRIRVAKVKYRRNTREHAHASKRNAVAARFCIRADQVQQDALRLGWFVPYTAVASVGPGVARRVPYVFPGDDDFGGRA